jgi:NAD(P)-dependent dehydrogenase (short-subunit alcohol dehydrogenase family)
MSAQLLAGRSAFVTGGAQGIGLAIAEAFLRQGARVTIADVQESALAAACAALEGLGPVRGAVVDVTDAAATETAAAEADAAQGGVDLVVANAGILLLAPAVDIAPDAWRRVLDVNLTGAFLTATAFARRMVAGPRRGHIIFTSSLFGLRGGVENAAYSASKFGMLGLMQCLAAELAGKGISVNAVCPGQIGSAMLDQLFEERAVLQARPAADLKSAFEARIPQRRLGTAAEVADTYVYLASDLARYVTGQAITVDGGWQVG